MSTAGGGSRSTTTSLPRLYLPPPLSSQTGAVAVVPRRPWTPAHPPLPLSDEQQGYVSRVLRLALGSRVRCFDGRNGEWLAELVAARRAVGGRPFGSGGGGAALALLQQLRPAQPPAASSSLSLAAAPLKPSRQAWVVEKSTELGVATLLPLAAARTASGPGTTTSGDAADLDEAAAAVGGDEGRLVAEWAAALASFRRTVASAVPVGATAPSPHRGWLGPPRRRTAAWAIEAAEQCERLAIPHVLHAPASLAELIFAWSGREIAQSLRQAPESDAAAAAAARHLLAALVSPHDGATFSLSTPSPLHSLVSLCDEAANTLAPLLPIVAESPQSSRSLLIADEAAAARGRGTGAGEKPNNDVPTPLSALLREKGGRLGAHVCLAVGPEGGWTERERQAATAAAILAPSSVARVGLGPHVLRGETASIAGLAALRMMGYGGGDGNAETGRG
jgi:16S rRNA U1498 N3-methylase RsmE